MTSHISPEKGRVIRIYRNGDPLYRGRKFVIHKARDFDSFLDKVTEGIAAPNGAVRRLCTPRHGHIVSSLNDLEDGCEYVACGQERFRTVSYGGVGGAGGAGVGAGAGAGVGGGGGGAMSNSLLGVRNASNVMMMQSPDKKNSMMHRSKTIEMHAKMPRAVRSGRAMKLLSFHPRSIFVVSNGDTFGKSIRVLLGKRTSLTLDQVLSQVTERLLLRDGCARKLCTVEGHDIGRLEDLEDGQLYVAVGLAAFKRAPYQAPNRPVHRPRVLPPLSLDLHSPQRTRTNLLHASSPSPSPQPSPSHALSPPPPQQQQQRESTLSPTAHPPMQPKPPAQPKPSYKIKQEQQSPRPDDDDDGVVGDVVQQVADVLKSGGGGVQLPVVEPAFVHITRHPVPPAKPKIKIQSYTFTVYTNSDPAAATTAKVYVGLHGEQGESGRRLLCDDSTRIVSGQSAVFALECPDIGALKSLTLSHDNNGTHPDWHVDRVTVRDVAHDIKYYFGVHRWLSSTRDACVTSVSVPASLTPVVVDDATSKEHRNNVAVPLPVDQFAARIVDKAHTVEENDETQVDRPLDEVAPETVGDDDVIEEHHHNRNHNHHHTALQQQKEENKQEEEQQQQEEEEQLQSPEHNNNNNDIDDAVDDTVEQKPTSPQRSPSPTPAPAPAPPVGPIVAPNSPKPSLFEEPINDNEQQQQETIEVEVKEAEKEAEKEIEKEENVDVAPTSLRRDDTLDEINNTTTADAAAAHDNDAEVLDGTISAQAHAKIDNDDVIENNNNNNDNNENNYNNNDNDNNDNNNENNNNDSNNTADNIADEPEPIPVEPASVLNSSRRDDDDNIITTNSNNNNNKRLSQVSPTPPLQTISVKEDGNNDNVDNTGDGDNTGDVVISSMSRNDATQRTMVIDES